jgi:hypothetical protein
MRRVLLVAVTATALAVTGPGAGVGVADEEKGAAGGAGASGELAPEADLAHHGHVSLWGEELSVRFASENHGPTGLPDATVRLDFSVPPAAGQVLPPNCLRGGDRVVLCRTGPLRPVGRGREVALDLRVAGEPSEVVVRISTAWNGGATDRNPENNKQEVLAPATGDLYAF